ncbi:hypothetical protein CR513_62508, partial [Mucuna pruriens]
MFTNLSKPPPKKKKQEANSYHKELLEVLPNLYRVILEGSMCQSLSSRFFSNSSNTALPPAWMQKCSKANLKSGMYGFIFILNTFLASRVAKNKSCSDMGRTNGPSVVILVLRASPATAIKHSHKICHLHPYEYALYGSVEGLFERRTAAPPILNRQFETSIDRLLPKYQLRVMFSMLTTKA